MDFLFFYFIGKNLYSKWNIKYYTRMIANDTLIVENVGHVDGYCMMILSLYYIVSTEW